MPDYFSFPYFSTGYSYLYASNGCKYFLPSVSKAQHGCIDCLAMMICAEFKTPESFASTSEKITIPGKKGGIS